MLSPQKFAKKVGLSYQQILNMCKKNEINAVRSARGHYKILDAELNKFIRNEDSVSREELEKLIRENERLKNTIRQFQKYIENIDI